MATGSSQRGAVAPGLGRQAESREATRCAGAAVDHFNERSVFSARSEQLHRCSKVLHMLQSNNSACMFFVLGMAGLPAPLIPRTQSALALAHDHDSSQTCATHQRAQAQQFHGAQAHAVLQPVWHHQPRDHQRDNRQPRLKRKREARARVRHHLMKRSPRVRRLPSSPCLLNIYPS